MNRNVIFSRRGLRRFGVPALAGAVALAAFFALRLDVSVKQPIQAVFGPPKLPELRIDFRGLRKAHAAENAWGFVRQSATWARANSNILDGIILPLRNSGILNRTGTYEDTVNTNTAQPLKLRLTVGANESHTASAYTGSRTFANKLEIWRASDNAKAMEIFFDNASSPGENGVLLYYQLSVINPAEFSGDSAVVESFLFGDFPNRKQTYSWSGNIQTASGVDRGRVVLEEMDSGTILCFQSIVRIASSQSADICSGGNDDYYSLAYTQEINSPARAVAKASLRDNAVEGNSSGSASFCSGGPDLNFARFNGDGFIEDGVAISSIPADFPPGSRVNTLFDRNGTTGKGGAGGYDDLTKATIDGLNIAFKSTSAPGF